MPRVRIDGGLIGVTNNPSSGSAGGMWSFSEHSKYQRSAGWPAASPSVDSVNAQVLVVAGGGGGSGGQTVQWEGGGGGAGGLIYSTQYLNNAAVTSYNIVVGAGGAGGAGSSTSGSKGSNSTFDVLNAIGGGFGSGSTVTGGPGGSGGGSWKIGGGGANTVGQGNIGGAGNASNAAGGGGGAGAVGGTGVSGTGGNGGDGLYYSISGSNTAYAGGGGGSSGGLGGIGGGGNGGVNNGSAASSGTANRGGGGGGGKSVGSTAGATGGSGIVVINYPAPQQFTGGTITNVNGSNIVHTFTSSGSLNALGYSIDTYFPQTTVLLHGDGTNGANNTVVVDSSVNALTVTNTGKPYQGTFSPFSQTGWSNYFDGSSSAFTVPYTTANFDWWTTDFTVEAWIYPTTLTGWNHPDAPTLVGNMSNSLNTNYWSFGLNASGYIKFYYYTGSLNSVTSNTTVSLNTWSHIAMTKTSSGITLWLNGVAVSSTTAVNGTPQSSAGTALTIGGYNAYYINGYVSNLRIVKGTALYTSSFTPSTTALTAVINTKLLTCQSNRFVDNSTNNLTHSFIGTPQVLPFSPFAPTIPHSNTTVGGSINLSGSSNYVTVPNATVVNSIGSGPFTIEGWFYPTGISSTTNLWGIDNGSGSTAKVINYFNSGTLYLDLGNMGATQFPLNVPASLIANSAWNHIAYVRSGTGTNQSYVFINGALANTGTISSAVNFTNVTQPFNVGYIGENFGTTFNGYVSNFRISNTALYTSTFTLPTAPSSVTSNTILQINGTNAGIIDHTAKNVLTTYGSAAISSTQSKFGGTSMYFNGTTDFASIRSNNLLDFGSGDFTIEMWVRFPSNTGATRTFLTKGWGSGAFAPFVFLQTATGVTFYSSSTAGSSWDIANGVTIIGTTSLDTWYHIAVTRNGSNFRIFVDGTQVGSTFTSSATLLSNSSDVTIGSGISGSSTFVNCYIDDLRITKGYARYTSNFTPPTSTFIDR